MNIKTFMTTTVLFSTAFMASASAMIQLDLQNPQASDTTDVQITIQAGKATTKTAPDFRKPLKAITITGNPTESDWKILDQYLDIYQTDVQNKKTEEKVSLTIDGVTKKNWADIYEILVTESESHKLEDVSSITFQNVDYSKLSKLPKKGDKFWTTGDVTLTLNQITCPKGSTWSGYMTGGYSSTYDLPYNISDILSPAITNLKVLNTACCYASNYESVTSLTVENTLWCDAVRGYNYGEEAKQIYYGFNSKKKPIEKAMPEAKEIHWAFKDGVRDIPLATVTLPKTLTRFEYQPNAPTGLALNIADANDNLKVQFGQNVDALYLVGMNAVISADANVQDARKKFGEKGLLDVQFMRKIKFLPIKALQELSQTYSASGPIIGAKNYVYIADTFADISKGLTSSTDNVNGLTVTAPTMNKAPGFYASPIPEKWDDKNKENIDARTFQINKFNEKMIPTLRSQSAQVPDEKESTDPFLNTI